MRVGILAPAAYPIPPLKYGGTERVIYHLIKGLKELGHEPILFGPGDSQVSCEVIPTTEESIPFQKQIVEEAIVAGERKAAMRNALEVIKKNIDKIDVLHVHESTEDCDVTELNIPMISTLHGPFTFRNIDFFRERNKKMLWVSISNNQTVPLKNLNYLGTIYNAMDPDEFQFSDEPQNQVCWVGRFSAEKGTHLALELAERLKLDIVLGGKVDFVDREYFVGKCYPQIILAEGHKVNYLGELAMKEKVEAFRNSFVNLHLANWREPFGLTVVEAQMCGTPTLGFRRGALPEIIEDGVNGILVEDIEEGAARINEAKNLDREKILEIAKENFHYRLMCKRYELAYEKAIEVFNNNLFQKEEELKSFLQRTTQEIKQIRNGMQRVQSIINS
jgi:glycosyltransferase involved in cell wall biosynthesis